MAHLRWLLCVATLLSCAHGSRKLGRRELTSEESTRCAVQLEEVRELKIPIAIARTVKGFSLAVYDVKKGVEDTTSAELLTKGMWDGSMSTRALEFAASSLGRAPASWKKCAQPPCYQHAAIDVGASVGWWSFNSASRGWKTVAIEASPMNVALLRVSMCLNPELAPFINLQHKLVGTHEGSCALAVTTQNVGNGYIHCDLEGRSVEWSADELRQLKTQDSALPVTRAFKVPVSRLGDVLDDVWEQDPKAPYVVSFMKLDLEGSEYAALNGTLLWLKKGRLPVIHSELWRSIHGGVEGYIRLLQKFGYSVRTGSCLNPNPIEQGIGVTFFRQAMRRITDITMGLVIRGAFDIGSAATKLQVAVVDVSSGKIKKVLFGEERQVFFALDMSKSNERALSHSIQDEGIRVLGSFMDVLSEHKAQQVSAIATEVFRRASNGDAYLKRVERELGLKIRMVTQEEEALLGYKTATGLCDPSIDTRNVIAWDTGGASFQISTMQQGVFEAYRGKFGSSIVTAMCLQQVKPTSTMTPNPVTPEEASQLGALIAPELAPPPSWLSGHVEAVGGPNSTFCLASRTLGKSTVSLADVEGCLARTCGRADSELRKMCHLSPKHDPPAMVVPKFVLLHTVMLHCGITDFTFIPAIGSCAGMLVSDELYAIGKL